GGRHGTGGSPSHDSRRGRARRDSRRAGTPRRDRRRSRRPARHEPLGPPPPHRAVRPLTRRKRLRFQHRVLVLVLLTVTPAWVATVILLTMSGASPPVRHTVLGFISLCVLIGLVAVRRHVVRPLQTLANMLEALREGDYSM